MPYLYAAGNPSTLSDPNGLCATFDSVQDEKGNWHGGSSDDGKGLCLTPEEQAAQDAYTGHVDPMDAFIDASSDPVFLYQQYLMELARTKAADLAESGSAAMADSWKEGDQYQGGYADGVGGYKCEGPMCDFFADYARAFGEAGMPGLDPALCADGNCTGITFRIGGPTPLTAKGEVSEGGWIWDVKNVVDGLMLACVACGAWGAAYSAGSWGFEQLKSSPKASFSYEVHISAIVHRTDDTGRTTSTLINTSVVLININVSSSFSLPARGDRATWDGDYLSNVGGAR